MPRTKQKRFEPVRDQDYRKILRYFDEQSKSTFSVTHAIIAASDLESMVPAWDWKKIAPQIIRDLAKKLKKKGWGFMDVHEDAYNFKINTEIYTSPCNIGTLFFKSLLEQPILAGNQQIKWGFSKMVIDESELIYIDFNEETQIYSFVIITKIPKHV